MIEILAATLIPLHSFDAQKLETLMRRIPSALVKTEEMAGFQRRTYEFPKLDDKGFKINCTADHYLSNQLPSKTNCTLAMTKEADVRLEEEMVEFKDPFTVKSLFEAISYQDDTKKFYANERIYGLAINGKYKEVFRYGFTCTKEKCQVTMMKKPSADIL
jgi:hypothetical protein